MVEWYSLGGLEAMQELGTSSRGLGDEEVKKRLEEYGWNELQERECISPVRIFIEQFKSALVLVLILGEAIFASIAVVRNEGESATVLSLSLTGLVANEILKWATNRGKKEECEEVSGENQ